MEQMNENNRKQIRLLIKQDVIINNSVKGCFLDVSEGGMFIDTHIPFPIDTIVELNFTLRAGDTPIKTQARVQSLQTDVGVGVVFINISITDLERLRRFIADQVEASQSGKESTVVDSRKKILLVDDSSSARITYKNKLVLAGFVIKEASSGGEAIKMIDAEKYDLVILDLQMEGITGAKLIKFLRDNEKSKDIKILILSGRITPDESEKVSAFGIEGLLNKMTTTPNKLADKVKEIFD